MKRHISTLLLLALLSLSAYAQPSSSSGPYALTLAKWQAILSGTKTASYIVDGSGACRALVAGDIPDLLATYAAASHTHAASAITSGTIATARLGSGTADSTTYLRGDNTWATPSGSVSLSSITSGTLATTLALGTQVVTSTDNTTWLNGTGKSIKIGSNTALLSIGSSFNTNNDARFALGQYAVGASNGSGAGLAYDGSVFFINTPGFGIKILNSGTEKYRLYPTLMECSAISLGGTIGSSTDPGAGSIAAVGNVSLGGVLTFTSAGSPTSNKPQIWTTGQNFDLCLNAPSGRSISAYVAGSNLLFNLGWSDNSYGSNRFSLGIFGSGSYSGNAANSGIASTGATSLDSNVATGGSITQRVNNVTKLTVDGSRVTCANVLNLPTASPASNGTGTTGDIAWDSGYLYICTGTNTWKRAALTGGY